jgi:hypothetical protein
LAAPAWLTNGDQPSRPFGQGPPKRRSPFVRDHSKRACRFVPQVDPGLTAEYLAFSKSLGGYHASLFLGCAHHRRILKSKKLPKIQASKYHHLSRNRHPPNGPLTGQGRRESCTQLPDPWLGIAKQPRNNMRAGKTLFLRSKTTKMIYIFCVMWVGVSMVFRSVGYCM